MTIGTPIGKGIRRLKLASNQGRDEIGTDAFEIDIEFADGNITRKVFLVNTSKGTKKIANCRPHAFTCVGMDLTNTVPVIVLSPLAFAMTDGCVATNDMVVTFPFVGVDLGSRKGEFMNMV